MAIEQQEIESWIEAHSDQLRLDLAASTVLEVEMLRRRQPELMLRLWSAGAWLSMQLEKLGCDQEGRVWMQHMMGQRSQHADPLEAALHYANEYAAGVRRLVPPYRLAEELLRELGNPLERPAAPPETGAAPSSTLDFMNALVAADPETIHKLLRNAQPASPALMELGATVSISSKAVPIVTVLTVINGLLRANRLPAIEPQYDNATDEPRLTGFVLIDPQAA